LQYVELLKQAGYVGDRYPLFFSFLILLKVQRKRRRYREAHCGKANPEEQKLTNQKTIQKKSNSRRKKKREKRKK